MTGILAHPVGVGGGLGRPGGGTLVPRRGGAQVPGAEGPGPGHPAVGAEAGVGTPHGRRREGVPFHRGDGTQGGGGHTLAVAPLIDSAGGTSRSGKATSVVLGKLCIDAEDNCFYCIVNSGLRNEILNTRLFSRQQKCSNNTYLYYFANRGKSTRNICFEGILHWY